MATTTTIMLRRNKNKTYLIAEVGQAHDGSLGILHSYIDALSTTGVDAIKFQVHIAEAESSPEEPFRINFSYEDSTRFDYWNRMSFSVEQWTEIKNHCEDCHVDFLASPFSQAAVDLLESLAVTQYKVGSGEVNNFLLLEKLGRTKKPLILSSGMSNYQQIDAAINVLNKHEVEISILQCTTSYPTPANRVGFNVMQELNARYPHCRVGISEHTGKIATGIAAVAMGAEIIEFHATFDRRMFGPDSSSSLTIDEISRLVEGVRFVEQGLRNPIDKDDLQPYTKLKEIFQKSLAVNKDLATGHILTFDDLEAKKPEGMGLSATLFEKVIGKELVVAKYAYEFLSESDLKH